MNCPEYAAKQSAGVLAGETDQDVPHARTGLARGPGRTGRVGRLLQPRLRAAERRGMPPRALIVRPTSSTWRQQTVSGRPFAAAMRGDVASRRRSRSAVKMSETRRRMTRSTNARTGTVTGDVAEGLGTNRDVSRRIVKRRAGTRLKLRSPSFGELEIEHAVGECVRACVVGGELDNAGRLYIWSCLRRQETLTSGRAQYSFTARA